MSYNKREVSVSDYKGHPILQIPVGQSDRTFGIGLSKAKAVLEYMDDVKKFVEKYNTNESKED